MKTLYLFTGLPGSGKSSVSRIFATKEKLPRVSKDDEQMTLFEKFGFNSNDEKKELVKKRTILFLISYHLFLLNSIRLSWTNGSEA